MTTATPQPQHPWLLSAGLGAGLLLGLAAIRWLPGRRRRSKIELIRERAQELTERIGAFTEDASERASDMLDDLKH